MKIHAGKEREETHKAANSLTIRRKQGAGIQLKILTCLIPIIIVVIGGILILLQSAASNIIEEKSDALLEANSNHVVSQVDAWMSGIVSTLRMERDTLQYEDMTPEEELAYLRHTAGIDPTVPDGIYFATTDGTLLHHSFVPDASYNPFEKAWYQDGIKSETFVFGGAYLDANTGNNVVSASSVLKNKDGSIRGVAAADVQLDAVASIVNQIRIEETGGAFLVDGTTNMILGHSDPALVGAILTDIADAPLYPQLAQWIASGSFGAQSFQPDSGSALNLNIQPVSGCGWVAVSIVPQAEIMAELDTLTTIITLIAIAAILILIALIFILIRRIVISPVRKLDFVAQRIADGDLSVQLNHQSKDEFGTLFSNFGKTVDRLHNYIAYIDEISAVLDEIANGNLAFALKLEYMGEFAKIKTALENISASLNETLAQINTSSDQVSAGADQLSSGAQTLSQGATEQAASVEELSATILTLAEQVHANASDSKAASNQVSAAADQVAASNERMQQLIRAMEDISNRSKQIDQIIKTIDDIAFQTNILALNAAVEAARAGNAGKGFAVVADEVRNLAAKSAEAAKGTADLIQSSVASIQRGSALADETATSLLSTVEEIKSVSRAVEQLSSASESQSASIAEVSLGIDQISSVVQNNSATAQETAAASEELSAQAQLLHNLVGRFTLKS